MSPILLGLIGDNIGRSKSPLLHRLAGELCGFDVIYEALIPARMGQPFDAVFETCRREGYRGINITYPYKERAVSKLRIEDPTVAAIAACNTVLFGEGRPLGFNTDYSGFMAAFRHGFPGAAPGVVALAGAGGVGKAISFALAELGATALRLFDPDKAKAEALAEALERRGGPPMEIVITGTIAEAICEADGVINCTPLGMIGHPGTAVPASLLSGQRWAFDSVYTPVDTQFLLDARRAGLETLSGYELFFHQGVDAFRLFTGVSVDRQALREALARAPATQEQPA
jgi:shikimate dehydrogenase